MDALFIEVIDEDGVCQITLDRPARLNALLTGGEIQGLGGCADRVRVLILGKSGDAPNP